MQHEDDIADVFVEVMGKANRLLAKRARKAKKIQEVNMPVEFTADPTVYFSKPQYVMPINQNKQIQETI